ncbi:MAG: SAM-dependent methyltransferase, partial [Acinetobacter sp.]|nr:SAM-dependent methyltransferase [Acinetobacter sp.]
LFLNSVVPILNSKGRLGFHTLMLSDTVLNSKQKMKYKWLLKAADVDLKSLMTTTQINHALQQHGLEQIALEDLSTAVLAGFSQYITTRVKTERGGLDQIKIQMTAKLCQRLFEEGIVRYIQLSAVKT